MKVLDLFSGIGGFSLGLERAGMTTVAFCEIEPYPQAVLRKNFPGVPIYEDVQKLSRSELESDGIVGVDVVCGGFPCQDISAAKSWTSNGANVVDGIAGGRSGLWKEYARVIDEFKPRYVVAENVKDLRKKGLCVVLSDLAELGYDAEWCVVSSAVFGAPHRRERLIIVAHPYSVGRQQKSVLQRSFTRETVRQASWWEPSRTVREVDGKAALPESFGIYDGVPRGLDDGQRIRCLGNSLMPLIPEIIGRAIMQVEGKNEKGSA
ncbi:MAG: hypothetical protein A2Y38_23765 [Spirochaetes bacterium GWB1_59_5]|nr:MAG: hypothetical protein A2Y38_23765 [Spirochaetes bacterium GWB1_59_5]